jgi:hypothetical protein
MFIIYYSTWNLMGVAGGRDAYEVDWVVAE